MSNQILAGDVGGTKTVLCIYEVNDLGLREVRKTTYVSGKHRYFDDLVQEFLATEESVRAACFGIAGPVMNDYCETTNLPWIIDARALEKSCGIPAVRLLNDLEAAAYGMLHLGDEDFVDLNPDGVDKPGHKAVLAAGTGLGEAILFFDGENHHAMATEGGHTDFAPLDEQQDALLRFLRKRVGGHVSYERILAGDGFGVLYDFLVDSGFATPSPELIEEMRSGDRNAVVSRHGLAGDEPICVEALTMFCRIYGSEAGNLALGTLPVGGVYVGGGIGPKIRPALEQGAFIEGFLDKGRMTRAIANIPVRLALNPEAPLLGAAHSAVGLRVVGR